MSNTRIKITQEAINSFERNINYFASKTFEDSQDKQMNDLIIAGMQSQVESLYDELVRLKED